MSVTNKDKQKTSWEKDSLVIVIRGCRGANKHLFALQLMHGLGLSIMKSDEWKKTRRNKQMDKPLMMYYSVNKPAHLLEDMYLDMLIERWISHINVEYKRLKHSGEDGTIKDLKKRTKAVLEYLFDTDRVVEKRKYPQNPQECLDNIRYEILHNDKCLEYIADNIIGYNARTNSIHVRAGSSNDDDSNLLFKRSSDALKDYFPEGYRSKSIHECKYFTGHRNILDGCNNCLKRIEAENESGKEFNRKVKYPLGESVKPINELCNKDGGCFYRNRGTYICKYEDFYDFGGEFLNVSVNNHSNRNDPYTSVRNAESAKTNFFKILNDIEQEVEKITEDEDRGHIFPYEAVVVEGFSHISEKNLATLPYTHLLNQLRKLSRISILVFEDTQKNMPDGDIEIEIRSSYDEEEDYSYNEIRISKCINQITALGWHLYKRQESHVRIYPSIHLLLFQRTYISNQMHDIHRSIMDNSYAMYLDSLQWEAMMGKGSVERSICKRLVDYENAHSAIENDLLVHLYRHLKETRELSRKYVDMRKNPDILKDPRLIDNERRTLANILLGKWREEELPKYIKSHQEKWNGAGLHDHCPTTVIVGNPNSHKRTLAMSRVFSCANEGANEGINEGTQVLIVLLDKDPEEMRRKVICPAMAHGFCPSNGMKPDDYLREKCKKCYDNITFLNINPGCITPEEFFSMLLDHIKVYTDYDNKPCKSKRKLHIVIDDYHRIDFCFPFFSSSKLFTTALISLCQTHNTGLTILCDKSSKRVREVCSLSDNVLCVRREEGDVPHKIHVYAERMGDAPYMSAIIRYDIDNVLDLMRCKDGVMSWNNDMNFESQIIGSMKEYWRETDNIISKPDHP